MNERLLEQLLLLFEGLCVVMVWTLAQPIRVLAGRVQVAHFLCKSPEECVSGLSCKVKVLQMQAFCFTVLARRPVWLWSGSPSMWFDFLSVVFVSVS